MSNTNKHFFSYVSRMFADFIGLRGRRHNFKQVYRGPRVQQLRKLSRPYYMHSFKGPGIHPLIDPLNDPGYQGANNHDGPDSVLIDLGPKALDA